MRASKQRSFSHLYRRNYLEETFSFCKQGAGDLPLASTLQNLLFAFFFSGSVLAISLFTVALCLRKPAQIVQTLMSAIGRYRQCLVVLRFGSTKIFTHKSAMHGRHCHSLHCTRRQVLCKDSKSRWIHAPVTDALTSTGRGKCLISHSNYLLVAAEHLTWFPVILAACSLNFPAS